MNGPRVWPPQESFHTGDGGGGGGPGSSDAPFTTIEAIPSAANMGQVPVTAVANTVLGQNPSRRAALLVNRGPGIVYLGTQAGAQLGATNGFQLGVGDSLKVATAAAISAIAPAGAATLHVVELADTSSIASSAAASANPIVRRWLGL